MNMKIMRLTVHVFTLGLVTVTFCRCFEYLPMTCKMNPLIRPFYCMPECLSCAAKVCTNLRLSRRNCHTLGVNCQKYCTEIVFPKGPKEITWNGYLRFGRSVENDAFPSHVAAEEEAPPMHWVRVARENKAPVKCTPYDPDFNKTSG